MVVGEDDFGKQNGDHDMQFIEGRILQYEIAIQGGLCVVESGVRHEDRDDLLESNERAIRVEGEEVFDSSFLGECDEVVEEAVGDNDFVFFKGCKKSSACTIILRGAN